MKNFHLVHHHKGSLRVKILSFLSICSIAILLGFYIFQANAMTEETYLLQNQQKKIRGLSQENSELEISLSKTNSLLNVEQLVNNLNFEKTNQIRYLRVLEGQVAVKPQ